MTRWMLDNIESLGPNSVRNIGTENITTNRSSLAGNILFLFRHIYCRILVLASIERRKNKLLVNCLASAINLSRLECKQNISFIGTVLGIALVRTSVTVIKKNESVTFEIV